jgi:hypothetical protein
MPVVEFVRGKRFILVDLEVRSKVAPLHAMKACGGVEFITPRILNLGTGCEWSVSCPGCLG